MYSKAAHTKGKKSIMSALNVGDLVKPIDTLIHKISDATGVLYEPRRIRRRAKAESEAAITSAKAEAAADIIKAESKIEITDLHQRAEQRRIKENMRHQKNMEDIIDKAIPHLDKEANPDAMEDDWIANFFDKSRIVSDSEMQSLWSRVLAGEANAPGSYSKRTVNLLSDLDKSDAELFTKLCGFAWLIKIFTPLVFDEQAEIYNRHGINFDTLYHLDDIGLVKFGGLAGFGEDGLPKRFTVHYYGRRLRLETPKEYDDDLDIGNVLLTKSGQELAPICGSKPVEGFYEYVKDRWKQYLPEVKNAERKE